MYANIFCNLYKLNNANLYEIFKLCTDISETVEK